MDAVSAFPAATRADADTHAFIAPGGRRDSGSPIRLSSPAWRLRVDLRGERQPPAAVRRVTLGASEATS